MTCDSAESHFWVFWNALKHILNYQKNSPRTVRRSAKIFGKWLGIVLKVIFECPRVWWNTFQHLSKILREQYADGPGVPRFPELGPRLIQGVILLLAWTLSLFVFIQLFSSHSVWKTVGRSVPSLYKASKKSTGRLIFRSRHSWVFFWLLVKTSM